MFESSFSQCKKLSVQPNITLITWETTIEHGLDWKFYDELTHEKFKYTPFLRQLIKSAEAMSRDMCQQMTSLSESDANIHSEFVSQMSGFVMCDLYCMVAALEPTSVSKYKYWDIEVELGGRHCRGMVAINWLETATKHNNVKIVLQMDMEKVKQCLMDTFGIY